MEDPGVLYKNACQLARSTRNDELSKLAQWLADPAFYAKLDSEEEYEGPCERLRIAGILQILAESLTPISHKILLELTKSLPYLGHRARIDLLIQALVLIKPAPQESVQFWDKYCQPEDGFTPITIRALLDNGSEPAVNLFYKKMLEKGFPETEREFWLTALVLEHRNDLPLLMICKRLLGSVLEEKYRLMLIDVLFDYLPDKWYGAGYWYKPPVRSIATNDSMEQLRSLGIMALQSQHLNQRQRMKIQQVMQEVEN